jgi:hypothetical protein
MFLSKGLPSSLISKYKDKENIFYYLFDKMYNETSLPLSVFVIKPEYEKNNQLYQDYRNKGF